MCRLRSGLSWNIWHAWDASLHVVIFLSCLVLYWHGMAGWEQHSREGFKTNLKVISVWGEWRNRFHLWKGDLITFQMALQVEFVATEQFTSLPVLHFSHQQNMLSLIPRLPKISTQNTCRFKVQDHLIYIHIQFECGWRWIGSSLSDISPLDPEICELKKLAASHTSNMQWWGGDRITTKNTSIQKVALLWEGEREWDS